MILDAHKSYRSSANKIKKKTFIYTYVALYRSGLSQTQNKLIEIQLDWFVEGFVAFH